MKRTKVALALSLILMTFLASASAFAGPYRGGHHHWGGGWRLGVAVGVPLALAYGIYGPRWYYPPYAYGPYYPPVYYPPVVSAPPIYIEQGTPQIAPAPQAPQTSATPQPGYWYYCAESKAYYPYVNQCAGGWQRVSPTPPPG